MDAGPRFRLLLEGERDETEREGPFLPKVRSSCTSKKRKKKEKRANLISLLRRLIELLRSSHDPLVLAVAAHDLGQYVKYHERGKK